MRVSKFEYHYHWIISTRFFLLLCSAVLYVLVCMYNEPSEFDYNCGYELGKNYVKLMNSVVRVFDLPAKMVSSLSLGKFCSHKRAGPVIRGHPLTHGTTTASALVAEKGVLSRT